MQSMFWSPEKPRPGGEKSEKSVNEKLLKMDIAKEQADFAAQKVGHRAEELKVAASQVKEDAKETYGSVIDAAEHLAEVLEKEEKGREHSE